MASLRMKDGLLGMLSERYRSRGYAVTEESSVGADGPRPDLLARKDGEERWVEVVGAHDGPSATRTEAMRRWAAERPHRHIDMVVGGVEPTVTVQPHEVLQARLAALPVLITPATREAACLTTWAVFEAVARRALLHDGVVAPRADILSSLGHWGVLDPEQIGRLRRLQRVRDAVAHGGDEAVDLTEVGWLRGVAEALLREADAGGGRCGRWVGGGEWANKTDQSVLYDLLLAEMLHAVLVKGSAQTQPRTAQTCDVTVLTRR